MSEQKPSRQVFNVTVNNSDGIYAGVARTYNDERVLIALERAQGFGQITNLRKKLPVGCRRGGCGICRARIIEGQYKRDPMSTQFVSEEEAKEGLVLLCAIYPLTDLKVQFEPKIVKSPQISIISQIPNSQIINNQTIQ